LTSEAIIGADLASEKIVLWNPAAEQLFGYPASEAIGMPLERLVPGALREQHLEGIHRYRESDGTSPVLVGTGPVDVPALRRDGTEVHVQLTLTDLTDGSSDRFVLALVRDVTPVWEAERQLMRTTQAMQEFVATASHDLRTPLTSVLGFARTLQDVGEKLSDEDRQECIAAILRGARHATRLVDDLLTLSQLRAGVMTARPEQVRAAEVAATAVAESRVPASVEIDPELVVPVDPHHFERILVNYLTNAGRYGRPPVRVTAEIEPAGGGVHVRVCDAGDGVPEEFESRLFTTFARADPASGQGTGLGLSIIRGLALANGGDVTYERSAEGCCFGVRLPLVVGAVAPVSLDA
jgi:PAS domain S-box-containing protein